MAEDSKVWDHIADLHRKHSELAIQMHEKDGAGAEMHQEMLSHIQELTAAMKESVQVMRELIAAVKDDVKADRAVADGNAPAGK